MHERLFEQLFSKIKCLQRATEEYRFNIFVIQIHDIGIRLNVVALKCIKSIIEIETNTSAFKTCALKVNRHFIEYAYAKLQERSNEYKGIFNLFYSLVFIFIHLFQA